MRRPLVLQPLSGAVPFARLTGLAALVAVVACLACVACAACGGNDKPPLTPDNLEPSVENAEAGAPTTPAAPPAK
jgi:hypothetical protein